jgi:hypothetical protein
MSRVTDPLNMLCESRQSTENEKGLIETDITAGGDFDASEVNQFV